jgi:Protein of unknown function (DUF4232)
MVSRSTGFALAAGLAALTVTLPFAAWAFPGASSPAGSSTTIAETNPPIGGGAGALAVLRPCASSQLRATVTGNERAMLHRELRITLTNTGTRACAIDGYPAVRLLDELRHPRITAESFSEQPRLFTIGPNQRAAFRLRIATGDGTTEYMTAPTLAIIPPGDTVPLLLNVTLPVAPTIAVTALAPAADSR